MADLTTLRRDAREIFRRTLEGVDAGGAMRRAVSLTNSTLRILDDEFNLRAHPLKIYSVAMGKAAAAMASVLDETLGERLSGGVVSATTTPAKLSSRWRVFNGGHPLPDDESIHAARAAFELLRDADSSSALIIFLVSGGGSAMLELPRDARVTLADLREANRTLVTCGASIEEINAVRRMLSSVKGGGLSARVPRAAQISLIVSDTERGREFDVASGPTFETDADPATALDVLAKYDLARALPATILRALDEARARQSVAATQGALRGHHVLLDNERAVECAAAEARARGYEVECARDIVSQHVAGGASGMISRLVNLYRRKGTRESGVCVVSGGEFSCPVRGLGVGGRNAETALRCAIEFGALAMSETGDTLPDHLVALCAGTDGIDGNSPAAGALADETTTRRAFEKNVDAARHLEESDAYTFFDSLNDAVVTGPTGTNVRDLRIMLAS
ncbi:MAG: DUF4147 domain-containing protein [Pyrinomonadaceae bacterium]